MQVKFCTVVLFLSVIWAVNSYTQEVVLSIGNICANAGDSTIIQVNLDNTVGDEVNVAEITIDFDTSAFEVTDVSRTERTLCHELFGYSYREEGIKIFFTNFCVVTPGTGSIADIHVNIGDDAGNGSYDWTLTETILSDLLGFEIPHITQNGTVRIPCQVNVQLVQQDMIPTSYILEQNYPNPFNLSTNIRFQIANAVFPTHTILKIYNILGQKVRTLVDEPTEGEYFIVTWDGRDGRRNEVSSGVYLYRLEAGGFQETKRMLLLK